MDAVSVFIAESAGVATTISVLGVAFRRVFKMGVTHGREQAERAAQWRAQAKAEVRVAELEAHVRTLESELAQIRERPQAEATRVAELEALVSALRSELAQIRGRRRRT